MSAPWSPLSWGGKPSAIFAPGQRRYGRGMSHAPRLYVTQPLSAGAELALGPDPSHYLSRVMRRQAGDAVRLFNGADGEWRATIVTAGKATVLRCEAQTRPQTHAPDLHLLFAPVKKART